MKRISRWPSIRSAPSAFGLLVLAVVAGALGCRQSEGGDATAGAATTGSPAEHAGHSAATATGQDAVVAHDDPARGALEVKSIEADPVDWYDVLRDGKRAFDGNPKLLNSTLELDPGAYVVDVNRTRREVTIEAGKKAILWTGELVVEGEPSHAFWYPMQGSERRLSSNPSLLNSPRALFPGTYTVFVYESVTTGDQRLGDAEVKAGQKTALRNR
jgi:hypothetical protein